MSRSLRASRANKAERHLASPTTAFASKVRWSEDFVERRTRWWGISPSARLRNAKAARLNRMIQWEVQSFATTDPLHDNGELLTLIRDVSRDSTFETLFVVHPERATVTSPDLDGRCRRIARRPGVIMEVHEKATRAEAEETVVQMLHEAFRVRGETIAN